MTDDDEPYPACPAYRPDHNGECLNCDEPLHGHSPEERARVDRIIDEQHLDRLVSTSTTEDLRRFRGALVLDIEQGADRAFCERRILAIDRELERRNEQP